MNLFHNDFKNKLQFHEIAIKRNGNFPMKTNVIMRNDPKENYTLSHQKQYPYLIYYNITYYTILSIITSKINMIFESIPICMN